MPPPVDRLLDGEVGHEILHERIHRQVSDGLEVLPDTLLKPRADRIAHQIASDLTHHVIGLREEHLGRFHIEKFRPCRPTLAAPAMLSRAVVRPTIVVMPVVSRAVVMIAVRTVVPAVFPRGTMVVLVVMPVMVMPVVVMVSHEGEYNEPARTSRIV